MIRVALDTTALQLGGGGVATYTRELREALKRRTDISLVEIAHLCPRSHSTARRITSGLDRELRWYRRGIQRAAKAANADLIHIPASLPVRSLKRPLVLTIHDAIPWRHPEWFTRANALQQRTLMKGVAHRATRVLTDSAASKVDLVEILGLDPDRVDVIHLGISNAFSPSLRDVDWLRARFGARGPVILSVGTPEPRKNIAGSLATFARVRAEIPDAKLLLVGGDGWRNTELETLLKPFGDAVIRAGRITFEELVRVYASADCFLFPSLREGFGFPPLEAMASGLPVVCSDQPSLPEVVGAAALTADPDDAETLAAHVIDVVSTPSVRDDLRRRGLERSAAFTWQRTADATVEAYHRALA